MNRSEFLHLERDENGVLVPITVMERLDQDARRLFDLENRLKVLEARMEAEDDYRRLMVERGGRMTDIDLVKRTDDLMTLVERLTGVVRAMGQAIEVLEAAEKKRSDREEQALRALGYDA